MSRIDYLRDVGANGPKRELFAFCVSEKNVFSRCRSPGMIFDEKTTFEDKSGDLPNGVEGR
ncbi:hypothetical protein D3C80_999940 [compost metagenome]